MTNITPEREAELRAEAASLRAEAASLRAQRKKNGNFGIEHADGRTVGGYQTLDEAIEQLRVDYAHVPQLEISTDPDRTRAIARDMALDASHVGIAYLATVFPRL